jgi:hypothetical protein
VENRCFSKARQILVYLDKQLLGSVVDSATFTFIPEGTQTFKAGSAVAGGPTCRQTFKMDGKNGCSARESLAEPRISRARGWQGRSNLGDPAERGYLRAVFPRATPLQGRHPDVTQVITAGVLPIPTQCISCHKSQGQPITSVMYLIHLSTDPNFVKPGSNLRVATARAATPSAPPAGP